MVLNRNASFGAILAKPMGSADRVTPALKID
jgi:hypothetical protein